MKRLLINLSIIIYSLSFSSVAAQTDISKYRPGVTPEGAIYYLPKTAVRVTLLVEKTTFTPGDFALYSNRYLRIAAETEAQTTFRVVNIKMHTIGCKNCSIKHTADRQRSPACNKRLRKDTGRTYSFRSGTQTEEDKPSRLHESGNTGSRKQGKNGGTDSTRHLRNPRES